MKTFVRTVSVLILSFLAAIVMINGIVILYAKSRIIDEETALNTLHPHTFDAVIVLGAGVRNNRPSPLLTERLDTGIRLYRAGLADTLILSGDSEDAANYDEVSVMVAYAVENGVPEEAILRDDLGLNTHRTVYRAKTLFRVEKYLLVSQNYHLERAMFLSGHFGSHAVGVSCDKTRFYGQFYRDLREIPARVKDFFIGIFQIAPRPVSPQ